MWPGVVEVKFRAPQRVALMHRLDGKLQQLDREMSLGLRNLHKMNYWKSKNNMILVLLYTIVQFYDIDY